MPWSQKKSPRALNNRKNKTNDTVTQDENMSQDERAAEEQCVERSFEGDQRWRRDD